MLKIYFSSKIDVNNKEDEKLNASSGVMTALINFLLRFHRIDVGLDDVKGISVTFHEGQIMFVISFMTMIFVTLTYPE